MRRVAFYVNDAKPGAEAKRAALAAELSEYGLVETDGADAEIVIALGGDGTILRAVHEFPGRPVLGLNLGGLGYLSAVGEREAEKALALLAGGRYTIAARALLEVRGHLALNDIAFIRELSGHAAELDLFIDGRPVTHYLADGLVFATPTGSTAYSLSAGGPVLLPDSADFVVTPMNPHALGVRPLVVRDDVRFAVAVRQRTDGNRMNVGVYADGENVMTLSPGEQVEIAKAAQTAKLVELEGYDPYDVLAHKLGWCR